MKSHLPSSGAHRAAPTTIKFNSGETRADQESAKTQSIDYILNAFTRGAPLPTVETTFADLSQMPTNITEMQQKLDSVYELFDTLPSSIRAQMNNDVRNYPAFVQSENGQKLLMEHGYIKPKEPEAPKAQTNPAPTAPPVVNDEPKSK